MLFSSKFVKLTNVFEELFISETGRDKNAGGDDKREKKITSISL